MIRSFLTILLLLPLLAAGEGGDYAGADACRQCHEAEYRQWLESDHFRAMAAADETTVLGNFSGVSVQFHGMKTDFRRENGRHVVDTVGDDGNRHSYPVAYTFGHFPLQQYLLDIGKGRLQAFDLAWDSRAASQGGQRWYHLQPEETITPQHPFFWTRHFQNWNSRCADCHSTNLERNYSAGDGSYSTTWSEINVACEACHGPGANHITLAQAGKLKDGNTGLAVSLRNHGKFTFAGDPIAANRGGASEGQLAVCGNCHSRREQIGPMATGEPFHDQFQLSLVEDGLYFADGQIDDEVFEYGSFLQSKMHRAGVACTSCHNPHSGKPKIEGNGLCLQCHSAAEYQALSHHHHNVESTGAQCVNCHMPERLYMGVDGRRDHSFSIPRPALAEAAGAPNACGNCHREWNGQETAARYEQLFGKEVPDPWAQANLQARRRDASALPAISAVARDPSVTDIRRATLVQEMVYFPSQLSLEILRLSLREKSPLIRAAAVNSSAFLPSAQRMELLRPLVADPATNVRMAVARQLADAFQVAPEADLAPLRTLFAEYENSLALTADSPATQLRLGSYHLHRGDRRGAEQAYSQALNIEPGFVPARINLADMKRLQGDEKGAEALLKQALEAAPDSGAAQHALGLLYVRQKQMAAALVHLEKATAQQDAVPHYSYVYGVALESVERREDAIGALIRADKRWPNQPESLLLLVSLLDQGKREKELLPYLSRLSRVAPGDPQVRALVRKYSPGNG